MTYTQAALAFDAAPPADSAAVPHRAANDTLVPHTHTRTPSNRRLPNDLWGEYRSECAMREQYHLPDMSLIEFADMRDWSDRREENDDDDDWITEPDVPPPCCHP